MLLSLTAGVDIQLIIVNKLFSQTTSDLINIINKDQRQQ